MAIIAERQNQGFSDDEFYDDKNSFWWTRVRAAIDIEASELGFADFLAGWTNREMVGLLWTVRLLHDLHDWWLLACEEEDQQGSRTSWIPPSKFLVPSVTSGILIVYSGF